MVVVLVYDTKPVHFLSMICESVKWVVKTQIVYNKSESKAKTMSTTMAWAMLILQTNFYMFTKSICGFVITNGGTPFLVGGVGSHCELVHSVQKFLKQTGLTLVSHYQYQQAVALGLIDPEKHGAAAKSSYKTPPHSDGLVSTILTNTSAASVNSGSK